MTPRDKIQSLKFSDSFTSILLDMSEIERARLARVLIEGIPWCRLEHFELGKAIRLHLKHIDQEVKEIDL